MCIHSHRSRYLEKHKGDQEKIAKYLEKHGKGNGTEKKKVKGKVNAIYTGDYKGNNKHGEGKMEWFLNEVNRWEESRYDDGVQVEIVKFGTDIPDGRTKYKWQSFLLNDLPHRCIPNGDTYDGDWKGGQMCGTGLMVYANGDTYDGMWENNLPHGTGVSTSAEKKGTWIVARWEEGVEALRIKKGTKMDETPNIDELVWMEKVQVVGQKIQYGPEVLGPGLDWERRYDVGVEERRCLILCSLPGGDDGIMDEGEKDEIGEWDERHTIFCHSGLDASSWDEKEQMISLECCDMTFNRRKTDPQMGVVAVVTAEGERHGFSTIMVDDDMGLKQMELLCKQLDSAVARNRDLDSVGFVKGARFAVVAFPAEETALCDALTHAAEDDLAKAFEGEKKVSICVTWSKEGLVKDSWWLKWVNMVRDAYKDGQQIVVFNRRNWTGRKEPRDVFISPDTSVDWPGRAVELAKGRPIKQHDVGTQRQVSTTPRNPHHNSIRGDNL